MKYYIKIAIRIRWILMRWNIFKYQKASKKSNLVTKAIFGMEYIRVLIEETLIYIHPFCIQIKCVSLKIYWNFNAIKFIFGGTVKT